MGNTCSSYGDKQEMHVEFLVLKTVAVAIWKGEEMGA
jgi:hypothetical protein